MPATNIINKEFFHRKCLIQPSDVAYRKLAKYFHKDASRNAIAKCIEDKKYETVNSKLFLDISDKKTHTSKTLPFRTLS